MTDKDLREVAAALPQEDRVKLLEYAYDLLAACAPRLEGSAQREATILLAQYPRILEREGGETV